MKSQACWYWQTMCRIIGQTGDINSTGITHTDVYSIVVFIWGNVKVITQDLTIYCLPWWVHWDAGCFSWEAGLLHRGQQPPEYVWCSGGHSNRGHTVRLHSDVPFYMYIITIIVITFIINNMNTTHKCFVIRILTVHEQKVHWSRGQAVPSSKISVPIIQRPPSFTATIFVPEKKIIIIIFFLLHRPFRQFVTT